MNPILDHPANASLVRSLCLKCGCVPSVVAADAVADPYYKSGSHPEIVERVWDQLGKGRPKDWRRILCGTPVLVDPRSGLVLAVCYGTAYGLRVPVEAMSAAIEAGCTTSQRWTGGGITEIAEEFGPDWVFGGFAGEEEAWCKAVAEAR